MNVRIRTAFVGREPELATLAEHLAHARAGRPQAVVVEGDPGTGKSALVQAFLDRLGPDVAVLRASGGEVEDLVAFGVVEQLVRGSGEHLEVRPTDEPPVVGAALVALLDRLRDRGGPMVGVVDDAHWADLPSVQAVVFALRRLGSDRVLTLVATRLPYVAVSASLSQAREVVHERGPTWLAIRSSIAIPGVYPPVHDGTQLLVDGEVMNNLPIDVMAGVVGDGPIVAVNLHKDRCRTPLTPARLPTSGTLVGT